MKMFIILLSLLLSSISYSQNIRNEHDRLKIADGEYYFENLTLEVSNSKTQTLIFSEMLSDTISLAKLRQLPLPNYPIFLKVDMRNQNIKRCVLWNDDCFYDVNDNRLSIDSIQQLKNNISFSDESSFFENYRISPTRITSRNEKQLEITFIEFYGSSLHNYPLQAKLTLTLHKH